MPSVTSALQENLVNLTFDPILPWWGLVFVAIFPLILCGYALLLQVQGSLLRLCAFFILLLLLTNPSIIIKQHRPLSDIGLVVVDESASQDIGLRHQQTDQALTRLRKHVKNWQNFELREIRVGNQVTRQEPKKKTNDVSYLDDSLLFTALESELRQIPRERIAGIVLISDGQIHDIPSTASALGTTAPISLLLTGTDKERDRRLTIVQAPRYGLVGKPQTLTLRVDDLGLPLQDQSATELALISIRQDGGAAETFFVPLSTDYPLVLTLSHAGSTLLEIEVEAGANELSLVNNRAVLAINGVRERLRVLLISGEPHLGERAWRNLLKADPAVDLVHFTILRPPEKNDDTPINELSLIAFPVQELFVEKLEQFDLIIFDRYRRRNVLSRIYLQNIVDYVQRGGALLDAVGPSYAGPLTLARTVLSEILPGVPTGRILNTSFTPQVVGDGHRHPVTAQLPGANRESVSGTDSGIVPASWGRWFQLIEVEAKRGMVVMRGVADNPLLILDRLGKGRVAQLLSDQMWLWAKDVEGGGPQAEFIRRIAHWLMKEPDLEENNLSLTVEGNHIYIVRRSLQPGTASVTLIDPNGDSHLIPLEDQDDGRATGSFSANQGGLYRVEDKSDLLPEDRRTRLAVVGALNAREYQDMRATAKKLTPLLEQTGGGSVSLHQHKRLGIRRVALDRDAAGSNWIGFRRNEMTSIIGVQDIPLLPPFLALLLGLCFPIWAWHREGKQR